MQSKAAFDRMRLATEAHGSNYLSWPGRSPVLVKGTACCISTIMI